MNRQILIICNVFLFFSCFGQNTVGVLSYDPEKSFAGYNLIYPHNQSHVYLIDNCGQIVHQWMDDPIFRPGNSVYLLDDGNLMKTKKSSELAPETLNAGGSGGIIELRSWDNELLWSTTIMDSLKRAHHDIAPMPNGNVLIISWEVKTLQETIDNGRDTSLFSVEELWPDFILEYDTSTDSLVWEWHAWDHLVQEFDETKNNYGTVSEHPELIDINFDLNGFEGRPDWLHVNAIDYNEELDQIVLSVPYFEEAWIIDHSTTTEEAKGHSGGNSGRGGDLLFRWGNPRAYKKGDSSDQKLFFQHDVHWIDDDIDEDHMHYGKMAVFNNRAGDNYSKVNIFSPKFDINSKEYQLLAGKYLPINFDLELTHPDTFSFFSGGLSSVQILNNENFLICSGRMGNVFEMTPSMEIVWEYEIPLRNGAAVPQGEDLLTGDNVIFRVKRYSLAHPAFANRDLTPKGYLELEPDEEFCDLILPTDDLLTDWDIQLYPNPAQDFIWIKSGKQRLKSIILYDHVGSKVLEKNTDSYSLTIDLSHLSSQVYFVKINGKEVRKIMVQP